MVSREEVLNLEWFVKARKSKILDVLEKHPGISEQNTYVIQRRAWTISEGACEDLRL